jgi:polyisoprenyl-phosphate glycosyltransferase
MSAVIPSPVRSNQYTISCILPAFNEAPSLIKLIPQLFELFAQWDRQLQLIVVDDGSADTTVQVFEQWANTPGFFGVKLSRNFGKEAAITAGLAAATGDAVILMDADLQHPLALLPQMLQSWQAGIDVVYAVRQDRHDEGLTKRLGTSLLYRILNTSGRYQVPANAGDFRLLDRKVVTALLELPERNRFMKGLYSWVGFSSLGIPYSPNAREHGKTSFNLSRLVVMSFDAITSYTTIPLRMVSAIGFVIALLAFTYGGVIALAYLINGNEVSGWTTIVVALMFFSGIQLLSLGIVGEYIGRIFQEVKRRPLYIVEKTFHSDALPEKNAQRKLNT